LLSSVGTGEVGPGQDTSPSCDAAVASASSKDTPRALRDGTFLCREMLMSIAVDMTGSHQRVLGGLEGEKAKAGRGFKRGAV